MSLRACWHDEGDWRGYVLLDSAKSLLGRHVFEVRVAGVYHRPGAQSEDFLPGRQLRVVPEPKNPHDPNALAIWNLLGTMQAGYVPAFIAAKMKRVPGGRHGLALSEMREGSERVRLVALISREPIELELVEESEAKGAIRKAVARDRRDRDEQLGRR